MNKREEGEDNEEDAHSSEGRAAPVRGAGGIARVATGLVWTGLGALAVGASGGGSSGDRRPGYPGARCEARQDRAPQYKELEVGRLHVRELIVEQERRSVAEQEQAPPAEGV